MFVFCRKCEQATLKCEDGWERAARKTTQNSRTAKKYKKNADFVHKTKAKLIENKTMQQKSTRSNESQQRQFAVGVYSSVSGSITICGTTDCNYTFRLALSLPASSCLTDQKVTVQRREHERAATYSHLSLATTTNKHHRIRLDFFIKSALYCCWCFCRCLYFYFGLHVLFLMLQLLQLFRGLRPKPTSKSSRHSLA